MTRVAARREPAVLGVAVAASTLFGVTTYGSAWVLGWVTDHVVMPAFRAGRTTAGALATAALLIIGNAALKILGIVGRRILEGLVQFRMQARSRRALIRQYLRLPLDWHQRHPAGQLLANANVDTEAAWAFLGALPMAIGVVVMLATVIVGMLVTDVALTVVALCVFPLLTVANLSYQRRLSPLTTRAQELRAEVSEIAHESFDGALVIKTLGREDTERTRFAERARELGAANLAVSRVRGLFDALLSTLPTVGVLAALLVGSIRLQHGTLATGDLVEVAYLFTMLAFPLQMLGWALAELPRSVVGWRRLQAVLEAGGSLRYGSGVMNGDGPARLEVRGITYAHDTTPVLQDVSFEVAPGRTLAVVGSTGSGKSTLCQLIVRLMDPDEGIVLVAGLDLRDLRRDELTAAVAFVPQEPFLFDDTVRGNITLGLEITDERVWAALRTAQAERFVRGLPEGLDTKVGERGANLSGGQRQRLALARALVRAPRLLVLDDATSSVDPRVEARILHALRHEARPSTIVLVAYRKATISLADEVLYVERGRAVGRGTHDQLLAGCDGYRWLITAYEQQEIERLAREAAERRRGSLPQQDQLARRRSRWRLPWQRPRWRDERGLARDTRPLPPPVHDHLLRRNPPAAATTPVDTEGDGIGSGDAVVRRQSAMATLRHGLALSPEFRHGFVPTLALAVLATAGKVLVAVAVQQTIDHGLSGPEVDIPSVRRALLLCGAGMMVALLARYVLNIRLYRATEAGLATLRIKAFRHIHDLSALTHSNERLGALISRVTEDIDQISRFMQGGGVAIIVVCGQLLLASVLMGIYSWQLAILVWVSFLPLAFVLQRLQRWLAAAYRRVRERSSDMLTAIDEAVVGAAAIRASGMTDRTAARIDEVIEAYQEAQTRPQKIAALAFSTGELVAAVAITEVLVVGIYLGIAGEISAGRLAAFLFLVMLFAGPTQIGTEVLNQAQNAIAGWRRVLGVLETPAAVSDPGERGVELPRGPAGVRLEQVFFAYPGGPIVVHGITAEVAAGMRVAIVGATGSGKTTLAKLFTRMVDPIAGRVLLDGADLRTIRFSSLRARTVMVPQDTFLFDGTLADNLRYGRPSATEIELMAALAELGLEEWLESLPDRLRTPVGQRGELLSAGEGQLVALARAHLAAPDLLVLDEATSALDPATDVRLRQALQGATMGRTVLSIAHRVSTAEAADEVLVVEQGRIIQRGSHSALIAEPGVYASLFATS